MAHDHVFVVRFNEGMPYTLLDLREHLQLLQQYR